MATIERGGLPSDNFTMLSNAWIRDDNLSFKARGLLVWLSSHAVGFRVSLERIAARSKHDGITSVRSAVKELEAAEYLVRRKERDDAGRIKSSTYVLQDPNVQVTPIVRKPDDGDDDANVQVTANMRFSHDGETPPLENPTRGEIEPLKKNISSKKNKNHTGPDLTIVGSEGEASPPKASRARATRMPDGWKPTEDLILWARDKGAPSPDWVDAQTEAFTLWSEAKGTTYVKWDRGWQNWIVRKLEDAKTAPPGRRTGTSPAPYFPGQGMFS